MNLELTSACPLRCPQCYCKLEGAQHMSLETACRWIDNAARNDFSDMILSGGETLCYPKLFEVIQYAKEQGLATHAAFSGWSFSPDVLFRLKASGLDNLYISINGSTEEINSATREGYQYAVKALDLLASGDFPKTLINWVMHSYNADDFPQMVKLAEEKHVDSLVIIGLKPNSEAMMQSVPSLEQMRAVASFVKKYRGPVDIRIESCYSPLLALYSDTWLGNSNTGIDRGCGAGLGMVSVNIDGTLSPCRHIMAHEAYDSIEEFYQNSQLIHKLKACSEENAEAPCSGCAYLSYCKPCMAINTEMYKRVFWGYPECPAFKSRV